MSANDGNENNGTPANDGANAPYPRATSRVSKCPHHHKPIPKTHFMWLDTLFVLLYWIYYIHLGHELIFVRSIVYRLDKILHLIAYSDENKTHQHYICMQVQK
jgi:hypothetical protein